MSAISRSRYLWRRLIAEFDAAAAITPSQLNAGDNIERWRAVRTLYRRPRPALLSTLLPLLADDDAIIRDETVRVLASWGPELIIPATEAWLQMPQSNRAIASALALYANFSNPCLRPTIVLFLSHEDPNIRAAAIDALAAQGDNDDIMNIIPLAEDPSPTVRRAACRALGRNIFPQTRTILQDHLHDPDRTTAEIAHVALKRA